MSARPPAIGPYRIEERLGAGGMGEVWRAWDGRLERAVAVKLIHPQAAEDGAARERFRREARAAAALSHPAIVQIHDIVSTGEREALVMELVDGEPLSRRIAAGPLPAGEAVRLGQEIAAGLAAAHARGLLHRDLKAENVMVTAGGHAKILDFGLAKRLDSDASLTRSAVVVGTFRAMSPEQARGLPLDPRSDLFSLGVLLYEMLTGRSPFRGESAPDTLARVCTARQAPVREIRPEVPAALSELVDRLLEKAADLRPQSAREVAAALARLAGPAGAAFRTADEEETYAEGEAAAPAAAAPRRPRRERPLLAGRGKWGLAVAVLAALAAGLALFPWRPPAALYVAVPEPVVARGGGEHAELMASGVRTAVQQALASLQGISPLAAEQVDPVAGTPTEVARAVAADELVTARLECDAEVCRIGLSRIAGRDGRLLWSQRLDVPVMEPYLMAEAVTGHLQRAYADRQPRDGSPGLAARPEDYAELLRLQRRYEVQPEKGLTPADLARLAEIRRGSPRFLQALLFEAKALGHRFTDRRDPADLERASHLLRDAREIAPADPRPLMILFEIELLLGQLDRAEAALRELERLQPGDPSVLLCRAQLLERRGRLEEALATADSAVRRHPSWQKLAWAADLGYRLGRTAEARRYLDELLRRFPASYVGRSMLAQIELLSGSPDRAAALYTDIVRSAPRMADLVNLGLAHLLQRRYREAEARFRQALELEPGNPFVALNLADALSLQGRRAEAEAGYRRVLDLARRDPAAAQWQLESVQAQAQAHLGQRREAVAAAQQVLRLAPNNPQAVYEAALVYALVGDLSSALFNAEKARELGVEPRWFSFPWFDSLRASPGFRDRLDRPA